MSMGDLAGDEVSRTMIHFIEHGRARPSRRVLELIARRTGRPLSYFVLAEDPQQSRERPFSAQLTEAAQKATRLAATTGLSDVEREAIKMVQANLRHAASLVRTLETRVGG